MNEIPHDLGRANAHADPDRSIPCQLEMYLSPDYDGLVDKLTLAFFQFHKTSKPRRTSLDQVRQTLSSLVANLAHAYQLSRDCHVAISLRRESYTKSRYTQHGIGYANLVKALRYLTKTNPPLVTYVKGFYDRRGAKPIGRNTRIKATNTPIECITNHHKSQSKSEALTEGGDGSSPTIKDRPRPITGRISIPRGAVRLGRPEIIRLTDENGCLIDYEDTLETQRMRQKLFLWNLFLAQNFWVDLLVPDEHLKRLYDDDPRKRDAPFAERPQERPSYVDFSRVRLHRVFNNSTFGEGGRFYGGWWQGVPSRHRSRLTINGVPTIEADYSNLHAAMLYAMEGLPLVEDAYDLPGVDPARYRKLIKSTFFKLINAREGQRIRPPREGALPGDMSWRDLQDAVKKKHQPIAKHFNSGIGLKLQRVDADIAENVILAMLKKDIPVLPIHDSFITYIGQEQNLTEEMKSAYQERMRVDIGVEADPSVFDSLFDEAPEVVPDLIEEEANRPGYEGYRGRLKDFMDSRNERWRRRFGPHRVS